MQKARCHPDLSGLQLIVSIRFQVLFHSPPGVLFTFPSRYYFTIGHRWVFSLTPWSGQIPTGFLVSRSTREYIPWRLLYFAYEPFTLYGSTFQYFRLYNSFLTPRQICNFARIHPTTPGAQRLQAITYTRFRLFPLRSPLLRESLRFLLLKVLRCFTSLRSPPALTSVYQINLLWFLNKQKWVRDDPALPGPGLPIRIPTDLRLFAPSRGFSQLITSFFAYLCQGIHHMPLVT